MRRQRGATRTITHFFDTVLKSALGGKNGSGGSDSLINTNLKNEANYFMFQVNLHVDRLKDDEQHRDWS